MVAVSDIQQALCPPQVQQAVFQITGLTHGLYSVDWDKVQVGISCCGVSIAIYQVVAGALNYNVLTCDFLHDNIGVARCMLFSGIGGLLVGSWKIAALLIYRPHWSMVDILQVISWAILACDLMGEANQLTPH